ncbi:putative receptor-like protein kinase [Hibiscus syriacus]|uniref:non-specific serine/threonine protein kinase n=1 Tax=Hibiscus syriacus TaxID=106335 RepID=A0A6A2YJY7_HIBSY|nr:putative receptor-like protein kinase [Hibiscus syriacus]
MATDLNAELSKKTAIFGLKFWEIIAKRSRARNKVPLTKIPSISKEIKEVRVEQVSTTHFVPHDGILLTIHDKSSDKDSDKVMVHLGTEKSRNGGDNTSRSGSFHRFEKDGAGPQSGEEGSSGGNVTVYKSSSSYHVTAPSPLVGLPEFSHLGWGHWFTLTDLELATNRFSKENVLGERGHGVVYRGKLINGTPVAVKKIFNLGQAEKEFRVEVEAIRHVRHKNLVRLLGYCIEGTHRMLVYEYVNNGNLEQWLHGDMRQHRYLTWEARIKILLGTAKALTYLHEAIEPKVVHRDIKSSNILIDDDFNAKVSDFGLAKYVAPEYANTGLLNEKSDVYSFGVVLLEAITGRDPWITAVLPRRLIWRLAENDRWKQEVRGSGRPKYRDRRWVKLHECSSPRSILYQESSVLDSLFSMMLDTSSLTDSLGLFASLDRRHRRTHGNSMEIDSQRENSDTDRSDCAASRSGESDATLNSNKAGNEGWDS